MSNLTAEEIARQMNAAFKKPVIKLGSEVPKMAHWPTGVLPFDDVLDGGLPVGRFVEVYGDYSTLKSYVAYRAIASVQERGGSVALMDTERAYDFDWGEQLGVDNDRLLIANEGPDGEALTGEATLAMMEILLRAKHDLIVWDSIAATQPEQYATKKPGEDLQPGGQARMMSAGLRRLNSLNRQTSVFCINQTRVNVGMTYGGARDSIPGGRAMGYYASYRLRLTKANRISRDREVWAGNEWKTVKEQTHQLVKVTLEKSKLSAPNRERFLMFDLETGSVDEVAYLFAWAMENGLIEVKGAWYAIDDLKVQGLDKFQRAFAEQKELLQWIRDQIMENWSLASHGSQPAPAKKKVAKRKPRS